MGKNICFGSEIQPYEIWTFWCPEFEWSGIWYGLAVAVALTIWHPFLTKWRTFVQISNQIHKKCLLEQKWLSFVNKTLIQIRTSKSCRMIVFLNGWQPSFFLSLKTEVKMHKKTWTRPLCRFDFWLSFRLRAISSGIIWALTFDATTYIRTQFFIADLRRKRQRRHSDVIFGKEARGVSRNCGYGSQDHHHLSHPIVLWTGSPEQVTIQFALRTCKICCHRVINLV